MIGFSGIRWSSMEHNLPGNGTCVWIPMGRCSQIGDFLQIVHTLEMGKHFSGVSKEVGKDVVNVSVTLENVSDDNVQIGRKTFFDAKPTET